MAGTEQSTSIADLSALLRRRTGVDLDAENLADLLWLATKIDRVEPTAPASSSPTGQDEGVDPKTSASPPVKPPSSNQPDAFLRPADSMSRQRQGSNQSASEGIPFQSPAAPALRQPLDLGRSLRPLMRSY